VAEPYLIHLEVDGKPEGKKLKTVEVERLLMDYLGGCKVGVQSSKPLLHSGKEYHQGGCRLRCR
jgi:hypothetical protein